jgi:hypothetical protein
VDRDAEEDNEPLTLAEMPVLLEAEEESEALALCEGCVD